MAFMMPRIMQQTHEQHLVKGEVLIEQGHDKKQFDPDKTYLQNMPVLIAFDHQQRLQRAYSRSGRKGVTEYIKSLNKIVKDDSNNS